MARFGDFLGDVRDILTGGFETALDAEITQQVKKISEPKISGDPNLVIRGNDQAAVIGRPAQALAATVGGVPIVWIVAGIGVVVLAIVLTR